MTNTNIVDATFITGNEHKARYLSNHLGIELRHQKIDLDELQSLDLAEIVTHKVMQAYATVQAPVLVEDVSLSFQSLGRLPGPFIKFFEQEMSEDKICAMLNGMDRTAVAACTFGFYDGIKVELFHSSLRGTIAETPTGNGGYGFDRFFIPEGYDLTRAQMNEDQDRDTYLKMKPFAAVRTFLEGYTTGA